jgi:phosphoribosylaminoimidazole (AIR) synthetase
MAEQLTYKDSGVDIDAGNKSVQLIKDIRLCVSTHGGAQVLLLRVLVGTQNKVIDYPCAP